MPKAQLAADNEALTVKEAVECVAEMLRYYEGQVWTRVMAEERARNIVTVFMCLGIQNDR